MDKSQYDAGLDAAADEAQTFGDKLKRGLATAAKVGAVAIAAVGTAAAAATTALVAQAGQVAAYGDNIDKASQKLGISAEAYQEWDAVLQHSGTSIDSLGIGMKTLASKAQSGSDAFTKLGISQKAAASMSREELFSKTITALQNVTDENERSALATELFGRSAMELGPLLNTSAADTQAMKDRVHELGGVMSNEAVKAAAAYQDQLQDMTTAFDGLKRNLMAEFLPSITTVMGGLTDLFSGGDGVGQISEGISMFIEKVSDAVPKILDVGSNIIMKMADAIIKNLPKLIQAATRTLLTFVQGIVKELPTLVKAGLQIIIEFARGIAEALPELIPTIVQVMTEIVDILTEPDTLSQLLEAGLQIMIALTNGIIQAIPKLIQAAPKIIANLVGAIIKSIPKVLNAGVQLIGALVKGILSSIGNVGFAIEQIIYTIWDGITGLIRNAANWGSDLIQNFLNGVKNMFGNVRNVFSDFGGMIRRLIGFSEPEEGPLSNFHTYAPDMMKLFAQGIKDNAGLISDAIGSSFDIAPQIASANNAPGTTPTFIPANDQRQQRMTQVIFEFEGIQKMVYTLNQAEIQRVGVKLAGGVL